MKFSYLEKSDGRGISGLSMPSIANEMAKLGYPNMVGGKKMRAILSS